ncbi:hypothetical protein Dimus_030278 [Dionaea muscipula]
MEIHLHRISANEADPGLAAVTGASDSGQRAKARGAFAPPCPHHLHSIQDRSGISPADAFVRAGEISAQTHHRTQPSRACGSSLLTVSFIELSRPIATHLRPRRQRDVVSDPHGV